MKINLEVTHTCAIKRKKPWPRISWIGQEKQQLFLLDSQRISLIDPKNGKTKRKVAKLSSLTKTFVSYNISSNGLYFVAILNNGDLIVWQKDIDLVSGITGLEEFGLKHATIHSPSVFISDDSKKIILITSRNKVFVWEADYNYQIGSIRNIHINGNWFLIEPDNKLIRTVEDNKELALHARFNYNKFDGQSATCSFAFNFENKLIVNILKIKWNSNLSLEGSKFETVWISHQPQLIELKPDFGSSNDSYLKNKMNCLYTRGAYVLKLSHDTNLLALACNQKYVERNCLLFMSPTNGEIFPVNLRNFGLNVGARGRHYWIHDLSWTNDDLYLAGITKHGAIFLVSRLGHPLFIHAIGKEINMGPALYLTLHPLIIVRGKSSASMSVNGDVSLSSTAENEDNLRQKYSIQSHPTLPILICSDGYLVCILKLQTAFATQSRLIRELMHETIGLLNSISNDINHESLNDPFDKSFVEGEENDNDIPDWGFKNQENKEFIRQQSEKSGTDSGVDSNEGNNNKRIDNNTQNQKISEGKIIFSFLPQILPISMETIKTGSISNRMETSFEYLQSSWGLLITMSPYIVSKDQSECNQIVKAIQQSLAQFTHLFISLESDNLKELKIYKLSNKNTTNEKEEEDFKLKVLIELFIRMLRLLYFDPCSKSSSKNPNSHMILYCSKFIENFLQSLLKQDNLFHSIARMSLFNLVFNLLNSSEFLLKSIYQYDDSVFKDETSLVEKNYLGENFLSFYDYIFEKSWMNLMHYAKKYRKTLKMMGAIRENQLEELDMFIIILQHKLLKYPKAILQKKFFRFTPIDDSRQLNDINSADLIYLDYGNLNVAIESWTKQLDSLFAKIDFLYDKNNNKSDLKLAKFIIKSIRISHKIFYACLANYKLNKIIEFINGYFIESYNNKYSPFILEAGSNFKYLQPPKPLQKVPIAIVCLIKSLARLISLYLTNKQHRSIFISSVHNNPSPMPNLISYSNCKSDQYPIEILKEKITICINSDKNLLSIFTVDKALELFITTGLYDEAIYFLNLINDWKSSFLIESILKENNNNVILNIPKEMTCEHVMSYKLCSLLGIDKKSEEGKFNLKLMEKSHMDSIGLIIKELLLCAAVTRTNVVESLLNQMMDSLIFYIDMLINKNGPIVPDDFYLPAPPIYCAQMNGDEDFRKDNLQQSKKQIESYLRIKICVLSKCIIILLKSGNLHVALIKWYLEQLRQASQQMNEKYGIPNSFDLNNSLNNLLVSIRYQKLGYITDNIMYIFRDFCCLIFYMDLRDRFSSSLRQYRRLLMLEHTNQYSNDLVQTCLNIIDYGNMMLRYRLFLPHQNHIEIQDIILSTISKLTNSGSQLNLEKRLSACVEQKPFSSINQKTTHFNDDDNFGLKLAKLLETWKQINTNFNVSMFSVYETHVLPNMNASNAKLVTLYGIGEDSLARVYFQKLPRLEPQNCGSYVFERTQSTSDFLDLFFKLGFDQTEDWDSLQQSVNQIPLLPEFYDVIRDDLALNQDFVDKQYLIKGENFGENLKLILNKMREKPQNNELNLNLSKKRGLFRTYSIQDLNSDSNGIVETNLRKASSFSNLTDKKNIDIKDKKLNKYQSKEPSRFEQPYKLLDYGQRYSQISNLSIWLIKWANKFQKTLLENNKTSMAFWYLNQENNNENITLKITCLNANFLVGSVYLADGNNLDTISKTRPKITLKPKLRKSKKIDIDEDLTQISSSLSSSLAVQTKNQTKIIEETSSSSTLDISSLTENQVKKIFKQKDQKEGVTDRSFSMVTPIKPIKSPVKQLSFSLNKSKDESTMNMNNYTNLNANKSLSSTFEASEFYNFNNIRPLSQNQSVETSYPEQEQIQNQSAIDTNRTIIEKIEENEDLNKTKKSGTFEFITSFFGRSRKNSSQSPANNNNRSKSPLKTTSQPPVAPPPQSPRHEIQKEIKVQNNNTSQVGMILTNQNQTSDVKEIIRNELKKIVQMQHDTVMNFLNGGANNTDSNNNYNQNQSIKGMYNTNNNLDQQLVSFLKQNQSFNNGNNNPLEFVIETKIKTIDPKTGVPSNNQVSSMIFPMSNNNVQRFENQENYFMKTFETNNNHSSRISLQQQQKKSSLIKIPLLNMNRADSSSELVSSSYRNYEKQNLPFIEQKKCEFKLLDFKSQQSNLKIHQQYSNQSNDNNLNKHIKEYIEINTKKTTLKYSNYPLLKLNTETEQKLDELSTTNFIQTQDLKQTIQSNQSMLLETNRSNKSVVSNQQQPQQLSVVHEIPETKIAEKESKEIQVSKPMYDGYVIAPDAFKDMISNENIDKQPHFDSAQAHFNATEHLRRKSLQNESINKNKKDSTTVTDNLENVFPIPPDILFKLKFDSKRMNREKLDKEEESDENCKDYVNVVDLDSNAVEDILKLIEHEQNKRQGKYVSTSPRKSIKEEKKLEETKVDIDKDIDLEETDKSLVKVSDSLTEKILQNISKTEDEYREYDKIMQSQIDQATKQAGQSIAKKRMLNEIKYIDDKIKLMNEMTNEMSSDYVKYNKIADTIQELGKQRELIQKCQQKQDEEEEKLKMDIKNKIAKKEKIKFYEKKQANAQINDLKKMVDTSITSKNLKDKQKTQNKLGKEIFKKSMDEDDDDELSDLKENEELKLKNILAKDEANNTSNSIANLLNDVFEDINSEKLDDVLELSTRETKKILSTNKNSLPIKKLDAKSPQRKTTNNNYLKPSKSPITNKKQQLPSKLNKTFEKQQIVSPLVKIEKEKLDKREQQSKQFVQMRTKDAKSLLEDMLIENKELASSIQKQQLSSRSPSAPRRYLNSSKSPILTRNRMNLIKSKTDLTSNSLVPLLNLDLDSSKIDLDTVEMSVENKKPSLMARTIMKLKQKEEDKQVEIENLLFMLEQRAKKISVNQKDELKPIKTIKSFTEMVKLQEPNKLRDHPDHKPMTYTQQLMKHQESTIKTTATPKDIYKLYGTKRVKGLYDGYVKEGPRKPRPYSERLKDLKPKESQAKIISRPSSSKLSSNGSTKSIKHNLKMKKKPNILNKNLIIKRNNRFKPYDSIELNEKIDDLSNWSLDDKMKRIIYDNGQDTGILKNRNNTNTKLKNKKQNIFVQKNADYDQDTLADMDPDYMLENLLEDEKQNELAYENALKSLNEIEKNNQIDLNEDYINKVDLEELENMSLSSGSAQLTSYIDWDQIDNLIQNFK